MHSLHLSAVSFKYPHQPFWFFSLLFICWKNGILWLVKFPIFWFWQLTAFVNVGRLQWIPRSQQEPLSQCTPKGGFKEGVPKNVNTKPWSSWEPRQGPIAYAPRCTGLPDDPCWGLDPTRAAKLQGLPSTQRVTYESLPAGKARQGEMIWERLTEKWEKPGQPHGWFLALPFTARAQETNELLYWASVPSPVLPNCFLGLLWDAI